MSIIGGSGSEKTNSLLNLIKDQDNDNLIDEIYLYAFIFIFKSTKISVFN